MEYVTRINELISLSGRRNWKYLRNLQMYTNSPNYGLNSLTDSEVEGYFVSYGGRVNESDTTAPVAENITKECIDTLKAMVAYYKARPFYDTYNGSVKDMKATKQVQQYFDVMFDKWNMTKLVPTVFKDACIFDTGYIYIDRNDNTPKRAMPWQVYYDPRQVSYGKEYECVYRQAQYPVVENGEVKYYTRILYWDVLTHKEVEYIQETGKITVRTYEPDELPFCRIQYSSPVKGVSNMSVCDLLYGIQQEITSLTNRIRIAEEKCPIAFMAIPEDSDIDVNKISNRIMQLIPYRTDGPGAATPITPVTPEPFSNTFTERLEQLKNDARRTVGLSEQSIQGSHTPGVNSGVAMGTLQNIEAQRFQAQTDAVIQLYVDVANKVIAVIQDGDILPKSKYNQPITWSKVRKLSKNMKIQYSAAESLSKDPTEKYKLLKQMEIDGYIPRSEILGLMEMPDVQRGYNLSNNVHNAVMAVIERCLDENDYDVPIFIPTEVLKSEIRSVCLNLEGVNNPDNNTDINKLLKLYDKVVEMEQTIAQQQNDNGIAQQETQQINAQTEALSAQSAQLDPELSQMQSIVNQIQNGTIDQTTAQQYLATLNGGGQTNGELVQ